MQDDKELMRDIVIAGDRKLRRGGKIPTVQALFEECRKSETFKRVVGKYGGFAIHIDAEGELVIDFNEEAHHGGTVH